ncbi:MAG TPA: vWA domain-containing protein [Thermoanaerobaculia bacterium]
MRLLLAVALAAAAVTACAEDPAGSGLDLLLLVDRSGSMAAHSPASIVDALPLTLNVLTWSSRSARANHRFGIVSFGSRARIDVPLTLVLAESVPALRRGIGALPSRSLGHTNLVAAFEGAAEAFRSLPGDPRRRRAILLLTDGHLDVPELRERAALAELERLVDSAFTNPPVSIDVLLLGARETFPWARVPPERVHRVRSGRAELLAGLHQVVSQLLGARSMQKELAGAADTLVLPPYLELVVFDIYRGGAAQQVWVLPPGSSGALTAQTPGVEEVHTGDTMATIVVRRPAAGTWTFRKSNPSARAKVLSQQFFPRGVLVSPGAAPPVRRHDAVAIGYRLDDGMDRPLQELPGYPLSVDVSLGKPDGERVMLPMARNPASRASLYESSSIACSAEGRYWTEVLVTTADSNGEPVRVFEDRWSGFTVARDERRPVRASVLAINPDRQRFQNPSLDLLPLVMIAVPVAVLMLLVRRRK